jgi:phosphatidylglycerophosphate synthase
MSDFRFNRILSKPLTTLLLCTPLTPNQITTLSLGLGIGAGFLFSLGKYGTSVAASFIYVLSVVLDNCDGEVARAKNMGSHFGSWYDIIADFITDISLFCGVALGALRVQTEGPVVLFMALTLSGTTLHMALVVLEKTRGFGPAEFATPHPQHDKRKNALLGVFDALREGESSWFVPLLAVSGNVVWLLWLGGVYVQFLWITSIVVNFRWLFKNKKPVS